mmetsp:Transcript_36213/g.71239  ORF Transcript_36213/g.71239 Transcript_36213/m.71239 type:complete len:94 (-) Transcript_36213:209-490(-)
MTLQLQDLLSGASSCSDHWTPLPFSVLSFAGLFFFIPLCVCLVFPDRTAICSWTLDNKREKRKKIRQIQWAENVSPLHYATQKQTPQGTSKQT